MKLYIIFIMCALYMGSSDSAIRAPSQRATTLLTNRIPVPVEIPSRSTKHNGEQTVSVFSIINPKYGDQLEITNNLLQRFSQENCPNLVDKIRSIVDEIGRAIVHKRSSLNREEFKKALKAAKVDPQIDLMAFVDPTRADPDFYFTRQELEKNFCLPDDKINEFLNGESEILVKGLKLRLDENDRLETVKAIERQEQEAQKQKQEAEEQKPRAKGRKLWNCFGC